jgi:hypothetical protein
MAVAAAAAPALLAAPAEAAITCVGRVVVEGWTGVCVNADGTGGSWLVCARDGRNFPANEVYLPRHGTTDHACRP